MNAPAVTVIDGLVSGVIVGVVESDAVTVELPIVFNVTLNDLVPPASGAEAGNVAPASVDVSCTTSVELTRFQVASTAFTVTVKGLPDV